MFNGMNPYTGGLHLYPLSWLFELFGYDVGVLRTVAVLCNAVAMAVFVVAIDVYWRDRTTTYVAAALLFALPVFGAYGRFGIEVAAFVPLMLAIAALLAALGATRQRNTAVLFVASGLLVGLATFTHIIAICVPAAVAAAFFLRRPTNVLGMLPFALGVAVILVPRILGIVLIPTERLVGDAVLNHWARLIDLPNLPGTLLAIWDGPLVYRRFTGAIPALSIVPATSAFLVFAVALRTVAAVQGGVRFALDEVLPAVTLVLAVLAVIAVTPSYSLRYFVLPSFLLPVIVARLIAVSRPGLGGVYARATAAAVAALCCFHLAGHAWGLALPHLRDRNTCDSFLLGSRLLETSCQLVETHQLYLYLTKTGVRTVIAPPHIAWPLEAHDIGIDRITAVSDPIESDRSTTAIVVYAGPASEGNLGPDLREAPGYHGLPRDEDSPKHFIVFRES